MKRDFGSLTMLGLLFGGSLHAQEAPKVDVFLGYSFLRANPARTAPAFGNHGGEGSLAMNINNNFGMEFDFGGYYNGNVNKRGIEALSTTFLFGPRLSFGRSKEIDPYFHVLFGGIYVSGTKPGEAAGTSIGVSQRNFAMATGGGVDIRLTKFMLFRPIQLDYFLTRLEDLGFSGLPTQNRNQHNVRASAGLVFQFGGAR